MSKCIIIPDVHLKPWMFDEAEKILDVTVFDFIVCLGDLVDDWNQEVNLNLYADTLDRCLDFVKQHENVLWCYGNHDVSYIWQRPETGYSSFARQTVLEHFNPLEWYLSGKISFIHRMDNVLFSHAGLTTEFVEEWCDDIKDDVDAIVDRINGFGSGQLWRDNSPIWARPQYGHFEMFPENMLQVVGHTPMEIAECEGNVLSLDTFSTYRDGTPIGNQRFVWVDTETMEWGYADE